MSKQLGRKFETEVLGFGGSWSGVPPHIDFEEAIELAIRKQPDDWHPLRPPTILGEALLYSVRSALNREINARCLRGVVEHIIENTGLYVALDTPADFLYHTDAIICCDLGFVCLVVTIDLKVEDDGEGDFSRDNHVIITKEHFTKVAANGKLRLDNIAEVIAEQLVLQLEQFSVLTVGASAS